MFEYKVVELSGAAPDQELILNDEGEMWELIAVIRAECLGVYAYAYFRRIKLG